MESAKRDAILRRSSVTCGFVSRKQFRELIGSLCDMTVHEALRNRFSCRMFADRELPKSILEIVLEDAFHAPSCENSQPWQVFAAGQNSLKQIRSGFEACRKKKMPPDLNSRFDGRWTEEMLPRIDAYFDGILAHEPRKNAEYVLQKRTLFNAPAMIYLCMDEELPTWSVFDMGMFAQSFMLSAAEHGLATMPSAVSVSYPEVVRDVLGIPGNMKILIGIGVGYADPNHTINHYRTDRKSIGEVRFLP